MSCISPGETSPDDMDDDEIAEAEWAESAALDAAVDRVREERNFGV